MAANQIDRGKMVLRTVLVLVSTVFVIGGAAFGASIGHNRIGSPAGTIAGLVIGAVAGAVLGVAIQSSTYEGGSSVRFVTDAYRRGLIDEATRDALLGAAGAPSFSATIVPAPVGTEPARPAAAVTQPAAVTVPAPPVPSAPATPPPASTPVPRPSRPAPPLAPRRDWLAPARALWKALASDFAVHGLTYLGVLLVFTATLGFVVFAFSDIGVNYRPLAELAIPASLFGAAFFLHHRGAPFVGTALEALGGAVAAIVAFAAFSDGAAVPPDLERGPLVVGLSLVALVLAAVYAFVARRRPSTPLRFLVAPLVWTAVGMVGLVFHEEPSAAQFALVLGAVAVTGAAVDRVGGKAAEATRLIVLPAFGVVSALVVVFAIAEGGPPVPVLAAAAAAVALAEFFSIARRVAWAIQPLAVVAGALGVLPTYQPEWVLMGAGLALLALAELWLRRGAPVGAAHTIGAAGLVGLALGGVGGVPAAAIASGSVLLVWSHLRRLRRIDEVTDWVVTGVAALAPAVLLVGLRGAADPAAVSVGLGAVVLAVALLSLIRHSVGWFYPAIVAAWSIVTLTLTAYDTAGVGTTGAAAAAGLATVALVVVPIPGWLRAWMASGAAVWTGFLGFDTAGTPLRVQAVVLAGTAVAAILLGAIVRRRWTDHLAAAGHVAAFGALAVPAGEWWTVSVIGLLTAGWIVEVVAHEVTESPVDRLFGFVGGTAAAAFPAAAAAALLPVTAVAVVDAAGTAVDEPVLVLVASTATVLYAAFTRLVSRRMPLLVVAAGAAALASIAALALAGPAYRAEVVDARPVIAALGAGVALPLLVHRRLRTLAGAWYGWILSVPLAVLTAGELGLPARQDHWSWITWGGVLTIGSLVADRATHGRRQAGAWIRSPWWWPPAAAGSAAIVIGSAVTLRLPFGEQWPVALAVAAIVAVVAVLSKVGAVSTGSYLLALYGLWSAADGTRWDVIDRPWVLVIGAGVMVVVAVALRFVRRDHLAHRWDLPALVGAHAAAVPALSLSVSASSIAATWAGVAGLAAVIAIVWRRWQWAAAGTGIALVASYDAGPWWFTGTLAATSIGSGAAAALTRHTARRVLWWVSALAGGSAWIQGLHAAGLSWSVELEATVVASAVVAVALGLAIRLLRLGRVWASEVAVPWVAVAGAGMVWCSLDIVAVARPSAAWWIVVALAGWGFASAQAARPLDLPVLRYVTTMSGLVAAAAAGWALEFEIAQYHRLGLALGVGAAVAVAAFWAIDEENSWVHPLQWLAVGSQVAALGAAAALLPARPAVIISLVAGGAQAAAAAVKMRSAVAGHVAAALLAAGWLVFASESLTGNVEWFTAPTGLAVLIMVEIGRWDRRRSEEGEASSEAMVQTEYLAMGFVAAPPLFEMLATSVAFGGLAVAFGTSLVLYGIATKVRRRVVVGGATVALAALLLIAVPVAPLLPQLRGPALWIALGVLGALLISAATMIERGRRRFAELRTSLDELTAGWE